eukprot:TRINITY_DN32137_c0_g1_i3.p2 TRINITY_DN32137_c0_g1~~TRINITY_DN32137_c0_g1_i3.p2  ORF type:complete len:272 (-),score=-48.25 TRINITY_DN32137_c0_g1_i3:169-864(-)
MCGHMHNMCDSCMYYICTICAISTRNMCDIYTLILDFFNIYVQYVRQLYTQYVHNYICTICAISTRIYQTSVTYMCNMCDIQTFNQYIYLCLYARYVQVLYENVQYVRYLCLCGCGIYLKQIYMYACVKSAFCGRVCLRRCSIFIFLIGLFMCIYCRIIWHKNKYNKLSYFSIHSYMSCGKQKVFLGGAIYLNLQQMSREIQLRFSFIFFIFVLYIRYLRIYQQYIIYYLK